MPLIHATRTTSVIALLLTAVALAAAFPAHSGAPARRSAASSPSSVFASSAAVAPVWLRTEMFFGLSSNATGVVQPISDAEFGAFLDATVTPLFPSGSSVLWGQGWYPTDGSHRIPLGLLQPSTAPVRSLASERSAVVILFHEDDGLTASSIRTIWQNYTTQFAQRSVLVSSQYSRVCFNDDCPSTPTFTQNGGCGSGSAGSNPPDFQDAGAWRQASYPDDPAWMRTEALFSLGFDSADPSAARTLWASFVNEVVAPAFPEGFTVLEATGRFPQQAQPGPAPGWSTDDDATIAETSAGALDLLRLGLPSPLRTGPARQLVVFHPDSRTLAAGLQALWTGYQSRFFSGQPTAPTGPAAAQLLSGYTFVCSNDQCAPTSVFGNCSSLSSLVAAGALANGSTVAALPTDSWDRTEIFFGLSVQSAGGSGANTTGRISDAAFRNFIDTIVVPLFYQPLGTGAQQPIVGLNLVNSSGQYLNNASVLVKEPSVQLTLTHINSLEDAEAIRKIWVNYTIEYQQESVLIDTQRAQVCFDHVCNPTDIFPLGVSSSTGLSGAPAMHAPCAATAAAILLAVAAIFLLA